MKIAHFLVLITIDIVGRVQPDASIPDIIPVLIIDMRTIVRVIIIRIRVGIRTPFVVFAGVDYGRRGELLLEVGRQSNLLERE